MSSLFQKSLGTFMTRILCSVIALIMSVIIARALGPEGKGAYALLTLIISMIASFGTLGMGMANIYFTGKKRSVEDIASNSLVISTILGGMIIIVSLFFLDRISGFVGNIAGRWFILALFCTVPLRFASFFMIEIILGQNKIRIYNIYNIMSGVLNLALLGLIWFLAKNVLTAALLAYLLTPLGLLFFTVIQIRKEVPIRFKLNLALLRESLVFGLKGHLGTILGYLIYRADMFLIALFLGPAGVGYYSIAVGLVEPIWYVPSSIATVLFPRVAASRDEDNNRDTPIICRNSLFFLMASALGLLIFGKPLIIMLYGESFSPSIVPLFLLLPGIVAMGVDRILSSHITASGYPLVPTYAVSASLTVNILLNLIFIPRWGIEGAAIATTIAYSLDAVILIVFFLRISRCRISDTLIIKVSDMRLYWQEFKKLLTPTPLENEV